MVETFPSLLVCEGDVSYTSFNSNPRRGTFTFERQGDNEQWYCIMRYVDQYHPICRIRLEQEAMAGVPINIVELCRRGSFAVCFPTGTCLKFRSIDGRQSADLAKIGELLLAIKNGRATNMDLNFGTAVHDMFGDSLASGRFGASAGSGNNGCQSSINNWKIGGRGNRRGQSRSFGGFDGGPRRFNGYDEPRGPTQNRYYDHNRGVRTYKQSHGSDTHPDRFSRGLDAQTTRSFHGSQRKRLFYPVQCKTPPFKHRSKELPKNSSTVTFEASNSNSRLLKDRGSAENSEELPASEREFNDLEQPVAADNKHEANLSVSKPALATSNSAAKQNKAVHTNGDPSGGSGILRDRKVVTTKVLDQTSTKGVNHTSFYGKESGNNFADSSPQPPLRPKSMTVKRPSLLSMLSPAKKNRSNSEEKENRLSVNGNYNASRPLDCYGFSNTFLQAYVVEKPNLGNISLYGRICELLLERTTPDPKQATHGYKRLLMNVKEVVNATISSFRGNKMEDAHEFLTKILEKMSEEFKRANKLAKNRQCTNPITHFFEYKILEKSTCMGCSKVVSNTQVLYDVGIPVSKTSPMKSLQQSINSLFKPEKREFDCDQCSHKERMVVTSICSLPRILSIHLKRYEVVNGTSRKNSTSVSIKKYLTLMKHVDDGVEFSHSLICPSSSSGSNHEASLEPCSDPAKQYKRHLVMEGKSLSMGTEMNGETRNGAEVNCASSGNPTSVYKTSKKQGLVGGQGPLKDVPHADQPESKLNEDKVPDATHQNPDEDYFLMDDSKDGPNDEDEELRKAKEYSLITYEEECSKYMKKRDEGCVKEDCLPDQLEEQNPNGDLPHTYQLTSVICHVGEADGGHYTCCEYDWEKNHFRCYSDVNISNISEQDFYQKIQNNGYILFFTHKNLCNDAEKK